MIVPARSPVTDTKMTGAEERSNAREKSVMRDTVQLMTLLSITGESCVSDEQDGVMPHECSDCEKTNHGRTEGLLEPKVEAVKSHCCEANFDYTSQINGRMGVNSNVTTVAAEFGDYATVERFIHVLSHETLCMSGVEAEHRESCEESGRKFDTEESKCPACFIIKSTRTNNVLNFTGMASDVDTSGQTVETVCLASVHASRDEAHSLSENIEVPTLTVDAHERVTAINLPLKIHLMFVVCAGRASVDEEALNCTCIHCDHITTRGGAPNDVSVIHASEYKDKTSECNCKTAPGNCDTVQVRTDMQYCALRMVLQGALILPTQSDTFEDDEEPRRCSSLERGASSAFGSCPESFRGVCSGHRVSEDASCEGSRSPGEVSVEPDCQDLDDS